MKRYFQRLMVGLLVVVSLPVIAQDKALPRVLIIGDSIYSQHARGAAADLKGRAEVVMAAWPSDAVANSATALVHVDQLLGGLDRDGKPVPKEKRPRWDMIHVNVGLGDLIYRAPEMKGFRVMPIHAGGVVATSPERYQKNLDQLMARLKATGAEVVWASTTPIRHSRSNVFEMGSEIEYNTIAAKVMAKHSVQTNDMYSYVKHLINMDKPAGHGFDPFSFDKKPIHMPIVRVIEQYFGLEAVPETDEEKAVREAIAEQGPVQG